MKRIVLASLLCLPLAATAQNAQWQLSAQFVPELSIYEQRYSVNNASKKSSLNYGGIVAVQHNFNSRLYSSIGLSYISRRYYTNVTLEQAALPPPKRSFSAEGVTTSKITYRVISVPLAFGFNFLRTKNVTAFATATVAANYLLNASYESNFSRYDGTYAKNELQGASLSAGAGIDYRLSKRFAATSTLSYAFLNPIREDEYLYGRNAPQALDYTAVNLAIGFRYSL